MSSRTVLIDSAQVGRAPRFVRERAHLVDEVWFVTHQAEQRRSGAQRAFRGVVTESSEAARRAPRELPRDAASPKTTCSSY